MKKYSSSNIKEMRALISGMPTKELYGFLLLDSILENLEKLNDKTVNLEEFTVETLKKMCEDKKIDTKDLKKAELIKELLG